MKQIAGHILTPRGFVRGVMELGEDGRIALVRGELVDEREVRDRSAPIVLPGFIDLHVHGGGGHDIMEGGAALARVAELHARHGTTAMLATTMTAPMADLDQAFAAMHAIGVQRSTAGARVLGAHLEGPYISQKKLGAQPDFTRPMEVSELQRWHALFPIRLITLAPEVLGNMDIIESLCAAGFKVQIGHSSGSYEDGKQALAKGASSFTHLFNAMTGLHHRTPGMVGAALAHAVRAEIIPDLIHVHPGAIRVALRAIPGLYCVTDSTSAAGMPDGEYRLGSHNVTKCLGGVRLADGTLAGSTLTMDQALRNLVDGLGLSLTDASRRVSTHAADYLGVVDRGRLSVGAWGDAVLLDRDLKLTDVLLEGSSIEHTHAD
ncbi:MAG: N-acetylglucosamine-6-phosphate deacetylase [Comamonadaceae bacterium]